MKISRRFRPVDLARLGVGVVALAAPAAVLQLTATDAGTARRVIRVLGARYVLQSGVGLLRDRPWIPEVDGLVDLVHAFSMIGVAAFAPQYRRLALTSAAAAFAFALADLSEPDPQGKR